MDFVKVTLAVFATSVLLSIGGPAVAQTVTPPSFAQSNGGFNSDMTVAEVVETWKALQQEASKSEFSFEFKEIIPDAALNALPVNIVAQAMVEMNKANGIPNSYGNIGGIVGKLLSTDAKGPDGAFLAYKPYELAAEIAKGLKQAGVADGDIATGMFASTTNSGDHSENQKAVSAGLMQAGVKPKDIVNGFITSEPFRATSVNIFDLGFPIQDVLDELTITGENPDLKNNLLGAYQNIVGGPSLDLDPWGRSGAPLSPENLALLGDVTNLDGRTPEQLGLVARAMMGQPGMTQERVAQAMNASGLPFATIAAGMVYGGIDAPTTFKSLESIGAPLVEITTGVVASGYPGAALSVLQEKGLGRTSLGFDLTEIVSTMTQAGASPAKVYELLQGKPELTDLPQVPGDLGDVYSAIDYAFKNVKINQTINTPLPGTGLQQTSTPVSLADLARLNIDKVDYKSMSPEDLAEAVAKLKSLGGEYTLANIAGMLKNAGVTDAKLTRSLVIAREPISAIASTLASIGFSPRQTINGLVAAKVAVGDIVSGLNVANIPPTTIVNGILASTYVSPAALAEALKGARIDATETVRALQENKIDVASIVVNANPNDAAARALSNYLLSSQPTTSATTIPIGTAPPATNVATTPPAANAALDNRPLPINTPQEISPT